MKGNAQVVPRQRSLRRRHLTHVRQRVPGKPELIGDAAGQLNFRTGSHWSSLGKHTRNLCVRIGEILDSGGGAGAVTDERGLVDLGLEGGYLWGLDLVCTQVTAVLTQFILHHLLLRCKSTSSKFDCVCSGRQFLLHRLTVFCEHAGNVGSVMGRILMLSRR